MLAETTEIGPFECRFARTDHSVQNHAILLRYAGKGFAYSGDGNITADSTALFTGADLVFQETYLLQHDPQHAAHCDLETVMKLASDMPVRGSGFIMSNVMRAQIWSKPCAITNRFVWRFPVKSSKFADCRKSAK